MKHHPLHILVGLALVFVMGGPAYANGLDRPDRPSPKKTAEVEPPKPLTATLAPNAASTTIRVTTTLSRPSSVTVDFISLDGGLAHAENYPSRTAGEHEFEINVQMLAAGLYYVKVADAKTVVVLPLVIVR